MLAKPAFGHQARLQRPMTHHRRIRGRGPRRPVRATGPFPPTQMGQTQRGVSAGVHTPGHRTPGRAKDRIAHGGHQHVEPELRTHDRMVVIGTDSHKRTHTVVAVDDVSRRVGEKTVAATSEGHLLLVRGRNRMHGCHTV